MKVQKNAAVALFVALGLKNADKWNDARLATKLGKIKEMVDEDVQLEADAGDLLKEVMAAAEAGEEFEVEDDTVQDAPAEQAEGDPVAEKAAKPKKEKKAKQPKQPKEKKQRGPTKPFLAGKAIAEAGGLDSVKRDHIQALYTPEHSAAIVNVTYYRSVGGLRGYLEVEEPKPGRLYLAGKLLKEKGLDVTDELVAELNRRFGVVNDKESRSALNHTKEVAEGYLSVANG